MGFKTIALASLIASSAFAGSNLKELKNIFNSTIGGKTVCSKNLQASLIFSKANILNDQLSADITRVAQKTANLEMRLLVSEKESGTKNHNMELWGSEDLTKAPYERWVDYDLKATSETSLRWQAKASTPFGDDVLQQDLKDHCGENCMALEFEVTDIELINKEDVSYTFSSHLVFFPEALRKEIKTKKGIEITKSTKLTLDQALELKENMKNQIDDIKKPNGFSTMECE